MIPAAGRVFGSYRLLRSVAADAVSTTYLATADSGEASARSGAPRFLVRIAGAFDDTDEHAAELVRQFLAQAQRAGAVDHPSIVGPKDFGVVDGHPFVSSAAVRAVPLGEMLAHGGAINESAALALFAQLAGALDAAHRADVVHGALSPRTIWVGPSSGHDVAYVGYLTGFGSGLLLRDLLTAEPRGAPVDDILYVAPEQLRGEPAVGATDQYSLACALYHTLIGQPPFLQASRSRLYGAHLMAPAPSLAHDDVMAETVGGALQRGMSKQPSDRFDSCGMLINAALPAQRGTPVGGTTDGGVPAAGDSGGARTRTRVLAGIGVIIVGIVVWLLLRPAVEGTTSVTRTVSTQAAPAGSEGPVDVASGRWSTAVADAPVESLQVLDGMIVVTAADGTITGVRPAAGRIQWREDPGAVREVVAGSGTVVYVGAVLTAIDAADGARRWSVDGAAPSSLHITGDAVVGAYEAVPGPQVRAVDLGDGSELWRASASTEASGSPATVGVGGGLVYMLQGSQLVAMDPSGSVGSEQSRATVVAAWTADVGDVWPLLAPLLNGVAVATRNGEICVYSAGTGSLAWCEAVPGSESAPPTVVENRRGVVAATPAAVVALELEMGVPLWSVSPGSPGNLVAVSDASVTMVDGDDVVTVLDAGTGDELLRVPDIGAVTALGSHDRWVLVGTADGRVRRFDIDVAG